MDMLRVLYDTSPTLRNTNIVWEKNKILTQDLSNFVLKCN